MFATPDGIGVGDRVSQEEIEDTFNTDFGYYVKGINPRRDENDNRYILLFANEDGPYGDSVTEGQFEYIGEGLEGDQSETSPGNSTLIDSVTENIPVYFFYKRQNRDGWEYQGQVNVLDYRREKQDGRQILVFTLEHQSTSLQNGTAGLYLIPVSNAWREQFSDFVEEPHNLQEYDDVPPQIEGIDRLRIWGATETDGDKKQSAINQMRPADCLLFYHDGELFAGGTVGRTFENPDVGELLWDNPESRHLFTVNKFTYEVPTIEEVWDVLGYNGRQVVQGFTRVADKRTAKVLEEHESLESAFIGKKKTELSEKAIAEAKSELEQVVESEPELNGGETEYVETRRKARDYAFTELVRDTYDNTCAICGSNRESPSGIPEVEAAHIYPKAKGGSEDIRNGIALCKLHHWAFDSGWLSFTDEYEVIVAEASDRNGYHELKQLEGQALHLPDNEAAHPHPIFIEQHREIHDFDR